MKRAEVCARFNIPEYLLALYSEYADKHENFDDDDITSLSLIISLDEMGFSRDEIIKYLNYRDDSVSQLSMLNARRDQLLRVIHQKELQLEKLDYMRFCLQKKVGNA